MFLGNFVKRLGQVMDVSAIKMKYYYYYYYYVSFCSSAAGRGKMLNYDFKFLQRVILIYFPQISI